MIPFERRRQMLEAFENSEVVTICDLKQLLPGTSESTIRRDLKALANEGEILILHGGAARKMEGSYDTSISSRSILNIREKNMIARCAAELVSDGEVVYLDAGSTALRMVKHLKQKDITIVSTNALIAQELDGAKCRCILVGGNLLLATSSLVGPMTDSALENLFFDKAFIGVSGFSLTAGINTPDEREAKKKEIVLRNSKKCYVLADSSKSGRSTLCKVTDLKNVTIICEKETPVLLEAGAYLLAER
ncbi:MAG: DeoR/GlpR family DNA-binding transcription regulator [Lachnospiraceae bacterium]|nr:DeoR/GlpR family DNA-binding transcription regulator [Lachnospiraceae bacterium]